MGWANTFATNTILQLSDSADNYKTLTFYVGSLSSPGELGWLTIPIRRWSESAWLHHESGVIAFSTPKGFMQLAVNPTTKKILLLADNLSRGIYGLAKYSYTLWIQIG